MNDLIITPKQPFEGFVNYFYRRTNVSDFITAEGERATSNWAPASSVLNYSIECTDAFCQWVSPSYIDNRKSFIIFTFECPIFLTHYTMRTRTDFYVNMPTSWKVECSIDKSVWHLIDTKTSRTELTTQGSNYTYECDKKYMYARYIRIWLTKSTSEKFYFHLSRAEFFGKLDTGNCSFPFKILNRFSCKSFTLYHHHLLVYILTFGS